MEISSKDTGETPHIWNELTSYQQEQSQTQLLANLPSRVLLLVLAYLPPSFIASFRRISKRFYLVSQLSEYWKVLDIKWVRRITTLKDLRRFVDAFVGAARTNVKYLILSSRVAVNATSIPSLLRSLPSLCSITIEREDHSVVTPKLISDKALIAFAESPYLSELCLPDQTRLTSRGVKAFLDCVEDINRIHSLDFSGCRLENDCLPKLLSLPALKTLKLRDTYCGLQNRPEKKNRIITELEIDMNSFDYLTQFPNVAKVKCTCKTGLKLLQNTISSLDRFVELDVTFNNTKNDEKQRLEDTIYSSSLLSLHLRNIDMKNTNLQCFTIRKVIFENCNISWERKVFTECPNIEYVEFSRCTFYDSIDIDNIIDNLSKLKTLKINHCQNLPMKQLNCHSLEVLECTANSAAPNLQLSISGLQLKTLHIQRFQDIQTLNIDCPNASDISIMNSELDAVHVPNLETFSIHSNKVTNLNLNKCSNLLHIHVDCPSLISLNVAESRALETFNVFAKSLAKLAIGSPKFVDYEWFETLQDRSPDISMLFLGGSGNHDIDNSRIGVDDELLASICTMWKRTLQAIIVAHNELVRQPKISCNIKGIQFIACPSFTGIEVVECPELFNIFINQCPNISSYRINMAAQRCPKLSNIKITGCVNVEQFCLENSTVKKVELTKNTALRQVILKNMERLETLIFEANSSLDTVSCTLSDNHYLKAVTFRLCHKITDQTLETFTQSCNNVKFGEFLVTQCEKISIPKLSFKLGADRLLFDSLPSFNYPIVSGKVKYMSIVNSHTTNWLSLTKAFAGCSNAEEVRITDCPNLSGINLDNTIKKFHVSTCPSIVQIKLLSGTDINSVEIKELSGLQYICCLSTGKVDTPLDMTISQCNQLRYMVGRPPQFINIRKLYISDCKALGDEGIQILSAQPDPPEYANISNTRIGQWPTNIPIKSVDVSCGQESEISSEEPATKRRRTNNGPEISTGGELSWREQT